MSGADLFNTLVDSTGLDGSSIRTELLSLLEKNNIQIEDLDLTTLRKLMANYLLDSLPTSNDY